MIGISRAHVLTFGPGDTGFLRYVFTNLNCTGNEESVFNCGHEGLTAINSECIPGIHDASLVCGRTGVCTCRDGCHLQESVLTTSTLCKTMQP